jgi:small-conductance mechanosensitive channel
MPAHCPAHAPSAPRRHRRQIEPTSGQSNVVRNNVVRNVVHNNVVRNMVETFQNLLTALRDILGWAPNTIVGGLILIAAAIAAILVHALAWRLLRRMVGARHPYLAGVMAGTRRLTLLAFVILALFVALPVAPFRDGLATALAHLLVVAAIVLVGWMAITASHIVAELYLLRFRLDESDNLLARKHVTQVRVLRRVVDTLLVMITVATALMTFEPVRQYGVSLFASAGVAGLVVGLAARPVLSNLIAGIQLAVTQPIRIDDAVLVENEFGNVEEITSTYVVLRLWDLRRMIVPLTHFIERPFQNWTRESTSLIGTVLLHVDYTTPVDRVRAKAEEIVKASPQWDNNLVKLQVTDATDRTMELRVIVSARSAGDAFDLRCQLREKLIDFMQRELPTSLPHQRAENVTPVQGATLPPLSNDAANGS